MSEKLSQPHDVSVGISGSFRKHMQEVGSAIREFDKSGVSVRVPKTAEAVNPKDEFVVLASDDPNKSRRRLQGDYINEIAKGTFHYVVNPGGYIGESAGTEILYARLRGIPTILAEPIQQISPDLSEETHRILRESIVDILPIDGISNESISPMVQRLQMQTLQPPLSDMDKTVIQKQLFSLFRSLPKEGNVFSAQK